jgi:hypothetical protein
VSRPWGGSSRPRGPGVLGVLGSCNPGWAPLRPWCMRRPIVVPAVAAAVLLAGCAQTATPTGPGAAPPPGSATTSAPGAPSDGPTGSSGTAVRPTNIAPVAPGGPAPVGPAQIDARALPGGQAGPVTVDLEGTALTVTGTEGSCSTVTANLLGEDETSVSVQLVVTRTNDGVCTAIAKLVPLTVHLAAPLADRTIVLSEVHR